VVRKTQAYKIAFLLDRLTLGELQSRTTVTRLVKQGRKPKEGPDLRPIVKKVKIVKGTSIPASTLQKFKTLKIKPGKTSIKKLTSFYDRWQYQNLRAAGVNYRDAKNLKTYQPDKIKSIISKYISNAKKIQKNYELSYYDKVKAFKKQEIKKPKKLPPPAPLPEYIPEESFEPSTYSPEDTFLDIQDEEYIPETEISPDTISEPPPNDYPTLDEVLYGMSISDHLFSEWDDIFKELDNKSFTKHSKHFNERSYRLDI
jgi:hypothetical protein